MMNSDISTENLKGSISTSGDLKGKVSAEQELKGTIIVGGSNGIKEIYVNDIKQEITGRRADINVNYEMLPDKPLINDRELIGGINNGYYADTRLTNTDLENIFSEW